MNARNPSLRPGRYPGNLPSPISSFVGRKVQLDYVLQLLDSHRIVTLRGVGGVGKTRLAIEAARRKRHEYGHGIWFVDLGPIPDETFVPRAVALALGLNHVDADLSSATVAFLSKGRALMVLDNCEKVAGAAARLACHLLGRCPSLTVLATSQAALGATGEAEYVVEPLDHGDNPITGLSEAGRLFAERARSAYPGFRSDGANATLIEQVVARLSALPLAIELAAPWVRTVGLSELLRRVQEPLELIGANPLIGARHETMRSAVAWSVSLLDPAVRRLWTRLAVFKGTFDLEAVTAVCSDDIVPPDHILSFVASMIAASLVSVEDDGGRRRYRMLDVLRAFAEEELTANQENLEVRQRHMIWIFELGEQARPNWARPQQVAWFNRFDLELDNVRAALGWALSQENRPAAVVQFIQDTWPWWIARGHEGEARNWIMRVVDHPSLPQHTRPVAFDWAAHMAVVHGEPATARRLIEASGALAAGSEDELSRAFALRTLAFAAYFDRDPVSGIRIMREAVDLMRRIGDQAELALAIYTLAEMAWAVQDYELSERLHHEALGLKRRSGDLWQLSWSHFGLGLLASSRGNPLAGQRELRDSLRLQLQIDNRFGVSLSLEAMAWIAADVPDPDAAARLLGAAAALRESLSIRIWPHYALWHEQCVDKSRRALGPERFDALHQAGARFTYEEAVSVALGGEVPARPETSVHSGQLTTREAQVARLIAQGLSNREIATELNIRERTAESHVENLMAKLGFHARTRVVAWVLGGGLGTDGESRVTPNYGLLPMRLH